FMWWKPQLTQAYILSLPGLDSYSKMSHKTASSSACLFVCCLFLIWLFIVSPVMSDRIARILTSTPSNRPSKMGVHGSRSPIAHSSTGKSSPSSVPGKSTYISYGNISASSSVSNTPYNRGRPYSRGCSNLTRCNVPP
ncbi:unnamed protein product, partial [Ilex paraguariensis]